MNHKSEKRFDIHTHTLCSDGSDTPSNLLEKAKEAGLAGISITDHDTTAAYTDDLFTLALRLNLRLMAGVEISSEMDGETIHVLGYAFDLQSTHLKEFLVEMQKRRKERNLAILEKLAKKNMPISEEELFSFAKGLPFKKSIGRPHIAALMVQKKFVRSLEEAFRLYLQEGGSCYVSGFKYTPEEAVQAIVMAKGKAVLAHPHFISKGKLLKKLLKIPFQGIECYYASLPKAREKPFLKIAQEKGWIATGGSDYHGLTKPKTALGTSWVDEDTFNALLSP